MPRKNPTNYQLFLHMANSPLADPSACLEWPRGRERGGYGKLCTHGKTKKAHRLAWELRMGPIPAGMVVCHRCDNPPCFRVDHLFLGTLGDNNRDAVAKGRNIKGAQNWKATLTDGQVLEIRRLRSEGWTITALALAFSVGTSTVFRIVNRLTWKHF
jgi:hypothetical protein